MKLRPLSLALVLWMSGPAFSALNNDVAFPVPRSHRAISRADRSSRIFGHFPDVDVVRVEWRTQPLEAQIPVPWLARKIHNWSARKIEAKVKQLPSSRDLYKSSIHLTLCQKGFLEFRGLIQHFIPGAARVAIRRPNLPPIRWFLRLLMRDAALTRLECGFHPGGNLLVSAVKPLQDGKLRRSLQIYAPFSSFQAILQKWEHKSREPAKDFRKSNEFARECLLWCTEQPQR